MKILIAFALFLALLLACLFSGTSVGYAIMGGFVIFFILGLHMGYSFKELWQAAWGKAKKSMIVIRILVLIGLLTGIWRASGTIGFCIYYGVEMIYPPLFVTFAFLLSAAMSYLIGTSFGITSTAGVIIISLARAGNVDPILVAGAILSGVYVGDRGAPASSSASLVAAVTDTQLYTNIRLMWKTGILAILLTTVFYTFLSFQNPMSAIDADVMSALASSFHFSWITMLPAIVMLVLPFFKVPILWSFVSSILLGAGAALLVQDFSVFELVRISIFGYFPEDAALSAVMSGGGVVSMLTSFIVVTFSGLYSGILEMLGVMKPLEGKLAALAGRIGRFPAMCLTTLASCMIFCNQTITIVLVEQLLGKQYTDRQELAIDIENVVITLSAAIPWSIACSVPLAMLGADLRSVPYAVLLWLFPVCHLFTKRFFFPAQTQKETCDSK